MSPEGEGIFTLVPCNGLLHSAHIRRPFLVVVEVLAVDSEDVGTGDAGGMVVVVGRRVVVVALARAEVGGDWVPAPFTCTGDALFTRDVDDDDDEWKLKGEDEGEIESGLPEIEERIDPAGDKGGGGGLAAVLSRCNVF